MRATYIKKLYIIKLILEGTLVSILIFFSITFLTVLFKIHFPFQIVTDSYELKLGFPFPYYHKLRVGRILSQDGWNKIFLLFDYIITWVTVTIIYFLAKRKKNK